MDIRTLGETGLKVTAIGLGTWAMGNVPTTWGRVDDNESIAAINTAIDLGVTLIDTAPIYGDGHSETIVGKAIRTRRSEVVLATKCGLIPSGKPDVLPTRNLKPDSIFKECEASLRRLQTDVIDIYQCHWPDPDTPASETMPALLKLLEQGKIRAIGVSNYNCQEMEEARAEGVIHSLQAPYSMLHRRADEEQLPYCRKHNIGYLAYGPLAKGLLTGKFDKDSEFTDIRARDRQFQDEMYERNLRIVAGLRKIAEGYGKTVGQLAVNWVIHTPAMTAALVGAKRPSQVKENVGAAGWELSREDRQNIETLLRDA